MLYLIVITFKKIDPTKSQGANRKRKKPGAGKSGFILKPIQEICLKTVKHRLDISLSRRYSCYA